MVNFPKIYLGTIWYRKSLFIAFGKGNHILTGSHFRILNFPHFNENDSFLWVTITLLNYFNVLLMILITFRLILMLSKVLDKVKRSNEVEHFFTESLWCSVPGETIVFSS